MTGQRTPRFLPFGIGIAILAVSTASILIRLAQQDAPSLTIAAMRLAIASLVLTPIVLARHRRQLAQLSRAELGLALVSGAFLALHFATWISSLRYTSVTSSVVLVSTGPIWVALLSPVFLSERLRRTAVLGLALAVVGGTVIAVSDSCTVQDGLRCTGRLSGNAPGGLWGNFLALAGAWAVTGYLIIGRRLRARITLLVYVSVVYGFAAILLIATAAFSGDLVFALPGRTYLWILLLAFVPQLIGHSTYNWALRYLPAAAVAVTTLGEPVGSAVLAFLLLQERPGIVVLAGAVLILAGIYLAARVPSQEDATAGRGGEV